MSAMNTMLTEMLKSLIPQEVLDLLTKENIDNGISKVGEYLEKQEAFQREAIEILRDLQDDRNQNRDAGKFLEQCCDDGK